VERFHTSNPRVFDSVLHGTDQNGSDIDLLVDALPGATLFDLGGGCKINWNLCVAFMLIC
jgi:predicted nucleotidyltransferase